MPIIQDYSNKHKPQIVLLSLLYIIVPIILGIFIFQMLPKQEQPQETAKPIHYICIEKDVEQTVVDQIESWVLDQDAYQTTDDDHTLKCSVVIRRNPTDANDLTKLFNTTYFLVANKEADIKNVTDQELTNAFVTQALRDYTLIWDIDVDAFLRSNFQIGVGQLIYSDEEINKKLQAGTFLAIRNESEITEDQKVIRIDDQSPYTKTYNSARYPLIDRYWIGGEDEGDIKTVYDILVENEN